MYQGRGSRMTHLQAAGCVTLTSAWCADGTIVAAAGGSSAMAAPRHAQPAAKYPRTSIPLLSVPATAFAPNVWCRIERNGSIVNRPIS